MKTRRRCIFTIAGRSMKNVPLPPKMSKKSMPSSEMEIGKRDFDALRLSTKHTLELALAKEST